MIEGWRVLQRGGKVWWVEERAKTRQMVTCQHYLGQLFETEKRECLLCQSLGQIERTKEVLLRRDFGLFGQTNTTERVRICHILLFIDVFGDGSHGIELGRREKALRGVDK